MIKFAASIILTFVLSSVHADEGARLFRAKCQTCHGPDGTGNPALKKVYGPGLNIVDSDSQNKPAAVWMVNIQEGAIKGKMPSFKDKLTEEQIKAVIAHVRSLAPPSDAQ